ncbi:hypothetical protein [Mycobacterium bourgelatii]|uniref:hypothetical protein n=1 Tax=Mycobacterium bourgelatii TaxID=1273442 RepID=UPI0013D033AA|nr:hypothetical protein [Mycobacterium bourgelatii]MCV6977789.1 hypothetical protein [Mycobacterium bourgelatii]
MCRVVPVTFGAESVLGTSVVTGDAVALLYLERATIWTPRRRVETQSPAAVTLDRGFHSGEVLLSRDGFDVEMLSHVLVLAGEGDRVGPVTALQIARVQITELIEADVFRPAASNAAQLVKEETSAVRHGEPMIAV